ncbi:glutathione S-transferase [Exophiala aquamarina CBS 119918]|uniref:Glutathione S-transferase n=1 Tax=Exophiala aquamarina CBS 119918 TaxID=1182545 RepID=A0A072PN05_9EURO|nr:glutathione S-transferase [Exophiala aquamarina CBS 119918]KEF56905.1 glutathione S-transferase [Exophiala aquamarina CBS 119918]
MWLLEELGIKYELKTYKRTKAGLAPPELKKVHPLGKSPMLTIEPPGSTTPIVLAESAAITEYLCDYFGKWLVPQRYRDGKGGQIGGETESWLRFRMLMHYAEGSLMPFMLISIIVQRIRSSPVPFFIKPITNGVAGKIDSSFLRPNFKTHYDFLEGQLKTSPDDGGFLCGKAITAADIMLSFPLQAGQSRTGFTKEDYPKVWEYLNRLQEREAYKRAVQKIIDVEGEFKTTL